jgi:Mg2+ and Co2+ transporter CorA
MISEKYKPTGDFKPIVPETDLRSCLIWFIGFLLLMGLLFGLWWIFKK